MKLVDSYYKGKKLLFDLADDPGEMNDLADSQPETVKRLSGLLAAWDKNNKTPLWLDPHGENCRKEKAECQAAIDAASQGEKK